MRSEVWRDVPGWEGHYQVSNMGRVKSLSRLVSRGTGWLSVPEKILSPGVRGSGHVTVSLGRHNSQQVHRLVMLAFKGACPKGYEVLHLNHNPTDNRLCNLQYGTRSKNLIMDYEAGTRKRKSLIVTMPDGSERKFTKLSDAADAFGVTQPAISHSIKKGYIVVKHQLPVRFDRAVG